MFIFGKNIQMVQLELFPVYGFIVGINYSNEDIEMIEVIADDKRHTIQVFLLLIGLNIHYFTSK
jgi:hypothetical protein